MGAPVILITGALTGIGRATAFAFAKEGATVVASGRREAEGKALEAELHSLGVEAAFILADVRHEDEVRNLVEQTVARFGRLDVAVNNAGTEGKPGPLAEQTSESYAGMFDTKCAWHTPELEARTAGHAAARLRQHHQYFFDHGRARCGEFSALHRKQARGGRSHEIRRPRTRSLGHPRQCSRAWSDRDCDARSSDRDARQKSGVLCCHTA